MVSADFNSVGSNPSIGAVGSTPSRSRQTADICCQGKKQVEL